MNYKITRLQKYKSDQGWLAELLREDIIGSFKQVYSFSLEPKTERGNHYHMKRKEWFCLIKGEVILTLWKPGGIEEAIILSDKSLELVEIPPYVFHRVENKGKTEAIIVSGTSDLYDAEAPDTYK